MPKMRRENVIGYHQCQLPWVKEKSPHGRQSNDGVASIEAECRQTAFNLPFQWGGDKRLYFNQVLNIVKQRELTGRSPSNQHDFNCTCSSI